MKVFPVFVIALLLIVFSCNENNSELPETQCFEVSYVTGICGQAVLKIEDPAFFKFGETWNDQENVFFTVFDCSAGEAHLNQAHLSQDHFFVQIRKSQPNPNINCAMCMAVLDYQGSKKYFVDIVSNCRTESIK